MKTETEYPFDIVIEVESEEFLRELWHRLNVSSHKMTEIIDKGETKRPDCPDWSKELDELYTVFQMIDDLLIDLGIIESLLKDY